MMTYFSLALNSLLMIVVPVLIGRIIELKRGAGWRLFAIGMATFVLSQVAHIPFNWLVLQGEKLISTDASNLIVLSLFLGLSAGVFEEASRYLAFRFWAKDARTWGKGLMLGAGHGGIESILLGIIVGMNFVLLIRMRSGALLHLVPEAQLPFLQTHIELLFSSPWHRILLGALERLFAICIQLSLSLLVMQTFLRKQKRWFLAALLWHAAIDALAVYVSSTWTPYQVEAMVGGMAIIGLMIIMWLRSPEPVEPDVVPLPSPGPARPAHFELTRERLENSRYQ